jgi:hypothetical protein
MNKTFNLKAFLKKAFYDDGRGYMLRGSRGWPNCVKTIMDSKNKSRQEAYMECIKQYNELGQDKWLSTYVPSYAESIMPRNDKPTSGSKGQQVQKK